MTKINQIGLTPDLIQDKKANPKTGDSSFGNILQEALASQPKSALSSAGIAPVNESLGLASQISSVAAPAALAALDALEQQGVRQGERVLELFEQYQQMLGDERNNLKQVSALLESLNRETGSLTDLMAGLNSNGQLYGLLEEIAAAVSVESFKFNRGDYLDETA